MSSRRPWLVLVICLAIVAADAPALPGAGESRLGVPWSELHYVARKLLLSARTEIRVDHLDPRNAAAELRDVPGDGGVPAGDVPVTEVTLETWMPFSRHEEVTVWLRSSDGTALQTEKLRDGKNYWKLRRYTATGFHTWRAEARSRAEAAEGPEAWSKRKESAHSWSPEPHGDVVVTDSYALLYLLSAARLDRPGASLRVFLEADDRLVELRFAGVRTRPHVVDFTVDGPEQGTSRSRQGVITVRELEAVAQPLDGRDDGEVATGLLDMKGPVTVLVEEGTGIPVQVEGKVDGIGDVAVKLERVVLGPDGCGTSPADGRQER